VTAQDMIAAARLTRVRELQTQLAKAAAENARLAAENAELTAHLDLALLAAEDLRTLPAGGRFVIVDGWNVILVARKRGEAHDFRARHPADLVAEAKGYLAAHPLDFVWIVFDGPRENSKMVGADVPGRPRLRISYTGGIGAHRADRFICDFLRMAKFRGSLECICVASHDKDFGKEVRRLKEA